LKGAPSKHIRERGQKRGSQSSSGEVHNVEKRGVSLKEKKKRAKKKPKKRGLPVLKVKTTNSPPRNYRREFLHGKKGSRVQEKKLPPYFPTGRNEEGEKVGLGENLSFRMQAQGADGATFKGGRIAKTRKKRKSRQDQQKKQMKTGGTHQKEHLPGEKRTWEPNPREGNPLHL